MANQIPLKIKLFVVIDDKGKIYNAFVRKLLAQVYISGFSKPETMSIIEGYFYSLV